MNLPRIFHRALALFFAFLLAPAAPAQECVTCWRDGCDAAMKSYLPKCAATPVDAKPAHKAHKPKEGGSAVPAEVAPKAQDVAPVPAPEARPAAPPACPVGQARGEDTAGHCCWPGQVWGDQCRGVPTSCPEGRSPQGESCELAACADDLERVDGTHCCWPGQLWSRSRAQCVGIPRCPPGRPAIGETCGDPAPTAGKVKVEPKSGLPFVYLPGGSFHYGCEPQDTQCFDNEKPGRTVSVGAFWLGKTDVTVAAYQRCVSAGACTQPNTGGACNWGTPKPDHPVNCLDWSQAAAFCSWAGGRLPTAEEWEYAAKGGESRVYPWGNEEPNGSLAKYGSSDGTAPVSAHPAGASKWGLLDMAGNVWQWTSNDYDATNKELRGDPWDFPPRFARASVRGSAPAVRLTEIGVRCGL